jgi:hypothetical protein
LPAEGPAVEHVQAVVHEAKAICGAHHRIRIDLPD